MITPGSKFGAPVEMVPCSANNIIILARAGKRKHLEALQKGNCERVTSEITKKMDRKSENSSLVMIKKLKFLESLMYYSLFFLFTLELTG
jgi:hypothetical protein